MADEDPQKFSVFYSEPKIEIWISREPVDDYDPAWETWVDHIDDVVDEHLQALKRALESDPVLAGQVRVRGLT